VGPATVYFAALPAPDEDLSSFASTMVSSFSFDYAGEILYISGPYRALLEPG
jgi:hypothetical protein